MRCAYLYDRPVDDQEGSDQTAREPRARNRAQEELLRQKGVAGIPRSQGASVSVRQSTNADERFHHTLRNRTAPEQIPLLTISD